jgi:hypothetical protein
MPRGRSYVFILVSLTLLAALSGILSNIVSSTLPETWKPHLWLAWPLLGLFMIITTGLVILQTRIEQSSTSSVSPNTSAFTRALNHVKGNAFVYDVFISYSSKDRDWVRTELLPRLEAANLQVCLDFRDFELGAPSLTEIERAVQTSHKTLLILTPTYLASVWAEFESLILQTLDPGSRERRLVPLLKARCDLPLRIRYLTYVDFAGAEDWDIAWPRLLAALGRAQNAPPSVSKEDPINNLPACKDFVGRQAEKAQIHKALRPRSRPRLVSITGIGGIGKTALALEVANECLQASRSRRRAKVATFDGYIWTSAKDRDRTLNGILDTIARTLEHPGIIQQPAQEKPSAVHELFRSKRYLLVVDGFDAIADQQKVKDFLLDLPGEARC